MAEVCSSHDNPVTTRREQRIMPYSGPRPVVEHELILLDSKHRIAPVMFGKENKTADA